MSVASNDNSRLTRRFGMSAHYYALIGNEEKKDTVLIHNAMVDIVGQILGHAREGLSCHNGTSYYRKWDSELACLGMHTKDSTSKISLAVETIKPFADKLASHGFKLELDQTSMSEGYWEMSIADYQRPALSVVISPVSQGAAPSAGLGS